MNKIKQNKITFSLILISIIVIFSSLTILSLPVIFNYKNKVEKIEKNFFKIFKIYLNTQGNVSYKPFPKPHLLVENATLNLSDKNNKKNLINTNNLKIYISLRDIYLRLFDNFISTEISHTNLEVDISDILEIRKHLYNNINNPINLINCKLFFKNKNNEIILISPIKKINYKIDSKTKTKNFFIDGQIFGMNYKSEWYRNFSFPNISNLKINVFNPNIEINNKLKFVELNNYVGNILIESKSEKIEYDYKINQNNIKIISPNKNNLNFKTDIHLTFNPFYFEGKLILKNQKVHNIIDNILLNLVLYNKDYLGNLSGNFKLKFDNIRNKLIKSGEIDFIVNEKIIDLKKIKFNLGKIGELNSEIDFITNQDDIIFLSKNKLIIKDHIEFAKVFQISSKKSKKLKQIDFNLEKKIGSSDFFITDAKVNNNQNPNRLVGESSIKNIQNLRKFIREFID